MPQAERILYALRAIVQSHVLAGGGALFPYWILFSLFAASAMQESPRPNKLHPYSFGLVCGILVLSLFIGLRFQVGGDWQTYYDMFVYSGKVPLSVALERGDPGYQAISWAIASSGGAIWQLNLVCGAIFAWGLMQLARNQPNPLLAICVAIPYLIVVVSLGYTRQAVAVGLIMAGLASVERGRGVVNFGWYVLLATLFHKTAVIALPVVMFAGRRNLFVNVLAGILLTIGIYFSFLSDSMDDLVKNYIDAGYQSQGAAIRVAMNVVPAALMLSRGDELQFGEYQYRLWRLIAFVAIALVPALILVPSSTAIDRLALYVLPIQVAVLPRFVFLFQKKPIGQALVAGYAAIVLAVWLVFADHSKFWMPYKLYPVTETARSIESMGHRE